MTKSVSQNPGNGGETHQTTDADHPVLTTNHGTPVSDNQNQLKVGTRGPVLLEDEVYRETAGADPDYQRRDLFERIGRGDYPEWDLGVQLFDEEFREQPTL